MAIYTAFEKIAAVTRIPADKVGHIFAGVLVAAFAASLTVVLMGSGAKPLPTSIAVAGIVFALTKEAADWLDNHAAKQRGEPPLHGVEVWDGIASAVASIVLAAVLQRWY